MTIKVIHIITGLGIGGAERNLFNLLNAVTDEERATCTVVSLTSMGTYGPKIRGLGIPVQALGLGSKPTTWFGLFDLRNQIRAQAPDVVVSWMYHANVVAWLATRGFLQVPRLVWNIRHSLYDLKDEKRLTRWVIRAHKLLSKSVPVVVYNSRLSRDQHIRFGICPSNSLVIPNGFDTAVWRPDENDRIALRLALGIPLGIRVVGHVSRYSPLKDQAVLLQAMRQVMSSQSHLHLMLVGRGVSPDNPALKEYFDRLPMERVHVLGERLDVPRLMRAIDIFCLSSRSEAFPNVLAEAMASGVACVTTNAGDAGLVVGESGRVVSIGDAGPLAEALLGVLEMDDAELGRLGATARERVVTKFSMGAALDAYRRVIRSDLLTI